MLCMRTCVVVSCFVLAAIPRIVLAQCTPSTYQTIVYDTLVTGSGNTISTFTFPKFDPALGTLVSVKLQSVVSVGFNFSLENYELVPKSFTVKIGRDDNLHSDAMADDFQNTVLKSYGPYALAASDQVPGSGTDYTYRQMNVLHNYTMTDSISGAVAPFMGVGTVSIDNSPSTYSFVQGSANFNLLGAAYDTTHFILTYSYCNAAMLPSGITVFSAKKEAGQNIQLNWQTVNEENGRYYDVEKSSDGIHFTKAGSVASFTNNYKQGIYSYKYAITEDDQNKLYFRLKRRDMSSEVFYSDVRSVNLLGAAGKSLYLYPNPSGKFINVNFNQTGNKNWQVDILSADGRLVQRGYYANTNTAHIEFSEKMKTGTYFMRVTDKQTQQNYISGFVVQ